MCLPFLLPAQCQRGEYRLILQLAQQDLDIRNYQRAINRLLDARDICPDEKQQINELIRLAFEQIDGEKQVADSALEVTERVLDQMYFYEGKFALTLKEIDYQGSGKYRYGFIDHTGKEVIPFEFDEATPFSSRDGFARVRVNQQKYLLDTAGVRYLLAEHLDELRPETEALDLHESRPGNLPEEIDRLAPGLRIILAYGQYKDGAEHNAFTRNEGALTELPASIGNLQELEHVELSYNRLNELPPSFSQLSQLKHADLSVNFIKTLPAEIGHLAALRVLDVRFNRIEHLPVSIGQCQKLTKLDLGSNRLKELPAEIGLIRQLEELRVPFCRIQRFPSELSQLSQLIILDARDNELGDFPAEIQSLTRLEVLKLEENRIKKLPETIGQLRELRELDVRQNLLTSLPASFSHLKQLTYLNLTSNRLEQFPTFILDLTELKDLYLTYNYLTDLPPGIG